jgi:hypothetical protein
MSMYISYRVGTSTKVKENIKYEVSKIALYAVLEKQYHLILNLNRNFQQFPFQCRQVNYLQEIHLLFCYKILF